MSRILGIDHGTKRIGIAMSDEAAMIAFGKEVIEGGKNSVTQIVSIVKENNVSCVVVGFPLNMKGGKSEQTLIVEKFIEELSAKIPGGVAVEKWDERLTSQMASNYMVDSGMQKKKRQDKRNVDMLSAIFILQSYLDRVKPKLQ